MKNAARSTRKSTLISSIRQCGHKLTALILLFGLAGTAQAVIIVSNTDSNTATLNGPANSSSLATGAAGYAFTTGSSGFIINEVSFGFYGNVTGDVMAGMRLYQGAGSVGSPVQSTAVDTFAVQTVTGGGTYRTWSSLNWTLNPNTTYTVMAYYGGNAGVTPRAAVSNESLVLANGLTGVNFYKSTSVASDAYAVEVIGVVPEPAAFALVIALGALGYTVTRRMRK